jgi:predicted GNAT family N-acyltransferase
MAVRPAPDEIAEEALTVHDPASAYTTVVIARTPEDLVAAARLRATSHETAAAPAVIPLQLDEHDAQAVHLLAHEDDGPVATLRLLRAEPGGELPVDTTFGLARDTDRRAAELSRPAIRPDRRDDPALIIGLLRAAYDEALAARVDEIYLAADQPLLTLLRGHGFRFRAVSGPMWANAAWSIAAVLSVDEVLPGLRLHQAVHGCRIADFFAAHFAGGVPGAEICARQAG